MKPFYRIFLQISLFASLLFINACSDNGTNSTIDEPKQEIRNEIDRVCDSLIAATPELSAVIIGIWDNESSFIYEKAYGLADTANNTMANTSMQTRVGSVTKTFTTTIALMMVNEGSLSLSDKVTQYLPEYSQLSDVTIEMLCNMTSGIFDYTSDKNFPNLLLSEIDKYQAPTKLVQIALNNPMMCTPGTEYHYSSTNTILLGMIIEKIKGKKINELINEQILIPNDLKNTYLPANKSIPINFLHGYYMGIDFSEIADPSWAWAAGGMVSDLKDLKKWVEVLVKGNLLSPNLQAMRFQNPVCDQERIYGLGISTIGNNLWGHAGTIPGYETIMMTDKTKDRTYVIFFNTYSDNISPESLLKRILPIIK